MTEQLETQTPAQTTQVVESDEEFIQVELPIFAHRSGKPVIIGSSVVTRYRDRVEIAAKLEGEDGIDFGSLLTGEYIDGLTIGGVPKPELVKRLTENG
jgi:hypothetical protein